MNKNTAYTDYDKVIRYSSTLLTMGYINIVDIQNVSSTATSLLYDVFGALGNMVSSNIIIK